jgi:hypothetical protein
VKRISGLIYDEVRNAMKDYLGPARDVIFSLTATTTEALFSSLLTIK